MFTPAMSASSTSLPPVIMVNAFSTHVSVPPFLKRLPLDDEMTTGLTAPRAMTVGPCWAMARPTAAAPMVVATKLRRVIMARATLRHPERSEGPGRVGGTPPTTQVPRYARDDG